MRTLASALAVCLLAASAAGAETLLKDGRYESYEGGAAIVDGDDILLTITADGCMGQAEGVLSPADDATGR